MRGSMELKAISLRRLMSPPPEFGESVHPSAEGDLRSLKYPAFLLLFQGTFRRVRNHPAPWTRQEGFWLPAHAILMTMLNLPYPAVLRAVDPAGLDLLTQA